ncbi:hypothetical protein SDC9_152234 [bioreactor metagenome]|uniref:Uncharacterized protein n=1 Tax=bioreactor metagenome TaxID=1076179 RepID=A0A645ESJ3_9ZZZZ
MQVKPVGNTKTVFDVFERGAGFLDGVQPAHPAGCERCGRGAHQPGLQPLRNHCEGRGECGHLLGREGVALHDQQVGACGVFRGQVAISWAADDL